jgi:ElaB/YqjD/DUF883 family membrane-anchored ribosome-binding protein
MSPSELLADIIHNIDPDEVPLEYIILAKVTDYNNDEYILKGKELERVMRGPERKNLKDARVILNVRRIRDRIAAGVNEIYDEINRVCQEEEAAAAEAALEEARAQAEVAFDEFLKKTTDDNSKNTDI